MIERDLRKLQAAQPKPGDRMPVGYTPPVSLGTVAHEPDADADFQRTHNEVMKESGTPTLGMAHDWAGMPQRAMELRTYGETALRASEVGGDIVLAVVNGNVFRLSLNGAANISITPAAWPLDAYDHGDDTGVDLSASLLISKGDTGLTISCDHWGPVDEVPDLSRAGFYEISVAICIIGSETIRRAWVSIAPPVPA